MMLLFALATPLLLGVALAVAICFSDSSAVEQLLVKLKRKEL